MPSTDVIKTVGLVGGYFLSVAAIVLIAVFGHDASITRDVVNTLKDIALGSAIAIGAVHLGSNIVESVAAVRGNRGAGATQLVTIPASTTPTVLSIPVSNGGGTDANSAPTVSEPTTGSGRSQ